jgi:hypothetical protein
MRCRDPSFGRSRSERIYKRAARQSPPPHPGPLPIRRGSPGGIVGIEMTLEYAAYPTGRGRTIYASVMCWQHFGPYPADWRVGRGKRRTHRRLNPELQTVGWCCASSSAIQIRTAEQVQWAATRYSIRRSSGAGGRSCGDRIQRPSVASQRSPGPRLLRASGQWFVFWPLR